MAAKKAKKTVKKPVSRRGVAIEVKLKEVEDLVENVCDDKTYSIQEYRQFLLSIRDYIDVSLESNDEDLRRNGSMS